MANGLTAFTNFERTDKRFFLSFFMNADGIGKIWGILIEPRQREETQTHVEIGQEPELSAPGAAVWFLCSALTLVEPKAVAKFSVAAQQPELHRIIPLSLPSPPPWGCSFSFFSAFSPESHYAGGVVSQIANWL